MIPTSLTLVAFLLGAPSAIFALGLLQPAPGVAVALLVAGVLLGMAMKTDWRAAPDRRLLAMSVAVAAALTLLSGVGHLFWQADDWTVRDAILLDLVRHPWPVGYQYDHHDGVLRAPIAMYLAPALVGKLAGYAAAQFALLAQNALLLGLCIYLFASTLPSRRAQYIAVGLFVAFSGLDCLPLLVQRDGILANLFMLHLEPWNGHFQYSSNVTEIFWTPHHGLAGWAVAAAYLLWRAGKISALTIAVVWAFAISWSPLATAGAIPFIAYAFFCDVKDGKLRASDFALVVVAGICTLPAAYFLTRDTGEIQKGFINLGDSSVLNGYFGLLLLEVAPYFALALHARDASDRRGNIELFLVGAALCLIPLYTLGFANDFAMRVSIVALTLLCFRAAQMLASLNREPMARQALVLGLVAAGAVTPAVEIYRNITTPADAVSACNVVESLKDGPVAGSPVGYYVADTSSFSSVGWLFKSPDGTPLAPSIKRCWPGRHYVYGPPSPA